jgi:hypothetical protein
LRELRLRTSRLTAAGFRALGTLSKLEVLEVTKADDAAVGHLSGLTRLRQLDLSGTRVTGRGVRNFPLLTDLTLFATPADDAGLAEVAALPRLRSLSVSNTRITGAALERLRGLRWLTHLFASETAIRDKDLVHLERLKGLSVVDLRKTRATGAGAAALQAKLKRASVLKR